LGEIINRRNEYPRKKVCQADSSTGVTRLLSRVDKRVRATIETGEGEWTLVARKFRALSRARIDLPARYGASYIPRGIKWLGKIPSAIKRLKAALGLACRSRYSPHLRARKARLNKNASAGWGGGKGRGGEGRTRRINVRGITGRQYPHIRLRYRSKSRGTKCTKCRGRRRRDESETKSRTRAADHGGSPVTDRFISISCNSVIRNPRRAMASRAITSPDEVFVDAFASHLSKR